jgi:tRNA nucleotidyltransferase/poly(A) polymerase
VVRAVGDARERFEEDKLRMLRAVRMTSRFSFALDAETLEAVRAGAHHITIVSPERIAQELHGMFGRPGQTEAARLLQVTGLAAQIAPEMRPMMEAPPADGPSAWSSTLAVLAALERHGEISFGLGLAAWLHQVGRGDGRSGGANAEASARLVDDCCRRWRLSNHDRERAVWLVRNQQALRGAATASWSRIQPLLAADGGPDLVLLEEAQRAAEGGPTVDAEFCRGKLALPREQLDPPPLVTGDHLKGAGLRPGPQFARLLSMARDAQLDGVIESPEEALAWTLRQAAPSTT